MTAVGGGVGVYRLNGVRGRNEGIDLCAGFIVCVFLSFVVDIVDIRARELGILSAA